MSTVNKWKCRMLRGHTTLRCRFRYGPVDRCNRRAVAVIGGRSVCTEHLEWVKDCAVRYDKLTMAARRIDMTVQLALM